MATPWMKFYPRDWRGDQALRMVSLAARGLWIECLAVMHEATPYGHLVVNGRPVGDDALARMVGASGDEVRTLLSELREAGVCDVTGAGVIFSRRMVRDQERAAKGRKAVKKRWAQTSENKDKSDEPNRSPNRGPITQKPEAGGQKGDARERAQSPFAEGFREAWSIWPKGQGRNCGEIGACRAWIAQAKDHGGNPQAMLAACRTYAAQADPEFCLGFDKFMHRGTWREWAPAASSGQSDPASWTGDQWRAALSIWKAHRSAKPQWWAENVGGPEPGQPSCQAPAEIQREFGFDPREQGRAA